MRLPPPVGVALLLVSAATSPARAQVRTTAPPTGEAQAEKAAAEKVEEAKAAAQTAAAQKDEQQHPHLEGAIKAELRGIFIVNLWYDDGTLYPGSVAYFAMPLAVSLPQFGISPADTVVGFKLSGLSLGAAQISGAMDINLRSPSPLLTANALAPQFYDAHIQFDWTLWRLLIGQYPDVVVPFVPDTVNSFPVGYVPGAYGYAHPQVRAEARLPVGEHFQTALFGSINRPVQTFDLSPEAVGRQAGVPDVQGRVAVSVGKSDTPWKRPAELGIAGHWGRRSITNTGDFVSHEFTTWSLAGDLRVRFPLTGTLLKIRAWRGQLLGDYAGGIFQTVNLMALTAIRARGGWVELQQPLSERWRVTVGYGRDDPRDEDLSPGDPSLNQEVFFNVLWDVTKTIGFGLEPSRWITNRLETPTTRVLRVETMFFLRF